MWGEFNHVKWFHPKNIKFLEKDSSQWFWQFASFDSCTEQFNYLIEIVQAIDVYGTSTGCRSLCETQRMQFGKSNLELF